MRRRDVRPARGEGTLDRRASFRSPRPCRSLVAAHRARSRARLDETAATTTRLRRRRRRTAGASPAPASFQRSSLRWPCVSPTQDASASARTYTGRAPAPSRVHCCDITLPTIHPPRRHIAEKFTTFQTQATSRVRPPARARAHTHARTLSPVRR